ncbi:MAG: 4-hydroxythreonine-4-phosphate dehydrogenase PdxA [Bdellovibrionota bacterium]
MLVVTLGDPYSISLECLFQIKDLWADNRSGPTVLVGAFEQWRHQASELKFSLPKIHKISDWSDIKANDLYFLDIGEGKYGGPPASLSERDRGEVATRALEKLRTLKPSAKLCVVTAPIDKFVASQAGFSFPGQTEFFADLWQEKAIMILAGPQLRVALATNHVKLSDVTPLITEELICQKIEKFDRSLRDVLHIAKPRIAVAALNPHAGDKGMFGDEDTKIILPAVERMKAKGFDVTGPKPADTVFFQAYSGHFDGVLAMYHDQGLAPLKALHFYDAVNISGGLPHLRISPDHGPASEIYGKNLAQVQSFRQSLIHARQYLGW